MNQFTATLERLMADKDRLRKQVEETAVAIGKERMENDRLRKALEDAPHGRDCNSAFGRPFPCNCWKSRALNPQPTEEGSSNGSKRP